MRSGRERKHTGPAGGQVGPGPSPGPDSDAGWRGRIQAGLVAWYAGSARALPWREDRDPYRILVSEMMLVQTTVAAVVPFFERFVARFPDIRTLAEADEADVLKAWEGLGYYRRARHLHAAARAVMRDHGGVIPDGPDALRALPGVGRYIAGAILSFAFGRAAPIVEANTRRVLARWLAWEGDVRSSASQARLWAAAERIVPDDDPATFNQAFMELGALVCVPRQPMCLVCPVASDCRARQLGRQDDLPVVTPRAAPREVFEACAAVFDGSDLLMVRRGPGGLWADFWELPTVHVAGPDPAGRGSDVPLTLDQGVGRLAGFPVESGPTVATIKFGVTKYRVTLEVHRARAASRPIPAPGPGLTEAAWVPPGRVEVLPKSAATRRVLAALGGEGRQPDRQNRRTTRG